MGISINPDQFADAWAKAWNAGDVEAVLAHFHDDVEFTSPLAAKVMPASNGTIRGKAALRDYWTTALSTRPGLRFEVLSLCTGVDILVINYRSEKGDLRAELLRFRDGLVVEGHGTYAAGHDA